MGSQEVLPMNGSQELKGLVTFSTGFNSGCFGLMLICENLFAGLIALGAIDRDSRAAFGTATDARGANAIDSLLNQDSGSTVALSSSFSSSTSSQGLIDAGSLRSAPTSEDGWNS